MQEDVKIALLLHIAIAFKHCHIFFVNQLELFFSAE